MIVKLVVCFECSDFLSLIFYGYGFGKLDNCIHCNFRMKVRVKTDKSFLEDEIEAQEEQTTSIEVDQPPECFSQPVVSRRISKSVMPFMLFEKKMYASSIRITSRLH